MLYRRNLCLRAKKLHNDNAPSLYGGRAFCLKLKVKKMAVFTPVTPTANLDWLQSNHINSLIQTLSPMQ
ncbi:hypothetical protein DVQ33_06310 [Yersinia enterocolitica]|nr:hypothetical protein [Yersinia enterocolitica]QBP99478.1 hypothetical protein YEY1_12235 [Yersinia enterocolitica subsp. palearctica]EKN4917675.1 hypothetical protein [Yersinia enterocolitica]EKN4920925.1 hypothetical protein [Yersinia enterocolitica]EKN4925722.1 hypothetical protein [Yersinia enterocolitica]